MKKLLIAAAVIAAGSFAPATASAHDAICGQVDKKIRQDCHYGYVKSAAKDRYWIRSGNNHTASVTNINATWAMCGSRSFCGQFIASYSSPGTYKAIKCGWVSVRIDAHTGKPVRWRNYTPNGWVTLTDQTDC